MSVKFKMTSDKSNLKGEWLKFSFDFYLWLSTSLCATGEGLAADKRLAVKLKLTFDLLDLSRIGTQTSSSKVASYSQCREFLMSLERDSINFCCFL